VGHWPSLAAQIAFFIQAEPLAHSSSAGFARYASLPERQRIGGKQVQQELQRLWRQDEGQDIAEYAVMLAVILVIVVGTIRLIGGNANNVFSQVGSAIQ
jgi:Flp pilus assembly pilin Flp